MNAEVTVNTTQTELVYTVKEVSEILRCGRNYVYKLIESGQLKSMKLGSVKIRKSTLEEFLAKWDGWDLSDPYNPKELEQ